jgi:hypothetical protein
VLEPFQENGSKKQTVAQCECPMPKTLLPTPPQEWKETNPFKKEPDVYLVKKTKTKELTPVQKA